MILQRPDGQAVFWAATPEFMEKLQTHPAILLEKSQRELIDDAIPTPGFGCKPYHVEEFPVGAAVCREDGFNCLSFKSKPGAKFTSPEVARRIAEKWNAEAEGGVDG